MALLRTVAVVTGLLLGCADAVAYSSFPSFLAGRTLKSGGSGCVSCHTGPDSSTTVTISGSAGLAAGQSGSYVVTANRAGVANGTRMGAVIAGSDSPSPLAVGPGQPMVLESGEVIHSANVGNLATASGDSASYTFIYTMPAGAAVGSTHSLFATSTLGYPGGWNHASTITVTTLPAAPASLVVTGTSTTSVSLSWSSAGPEYRVVYRAGSTAPSSEADGTIFEAGTAMTATITGLSPATQYRFAVYSRGGTPPVFSATAATTSATTGALPVATTTTLVSSSNPSIQGAQVTFTATVSAGSGTPGGSVTFKDGATTLCGAVALVAAKATCATSTLTVGTHSIVAEYSGSSTFNASASGALSHVVQPTAFALTVSKAGAGSGTVTSSPAGINCGTTCAADFATASTVTLTAAAATGSIFVGWSGSRCSGTASCPVTMSAASAVAATFDLAQGPVSRTPPSIAFGGQSMGTTSAPLTVTVTNTGAASVTISAVTLSSSQFGRTHDCGTLAVSATCAIQVTFSPAAAAGALNARTDIAATLTIEHTGGGSSLAVSLTGVAEKSLVTHYYRSILRRAADDAGKAFWESEAARVQALGANVSEVWFALAGSFYSSAEYLAQNRDNAGFVTDLYNTFFNRAPDSGGFADWTGLLASGMPREVVLASFMFSAEFGTFTQAIFGTSTTRKEIDTVVDFYRGLLGRLPDDAGFAFWLQRFRTAQCQGASAVTVQAESISSLYATSGEYLARNRTNSQYVGDLYNAFLRRGGDLAGVQFWINQIATSARTRENVRQQFVASPEFSARVNAVISQGCQS